MHVKLCLRSQVFRVEILQVWAWHLPPRENLEESVLPGPQVADECAIAPRMGLGEAVCLIAGELLDVVGVVIPDIGAKSSLVCRSAGVIRPELGAFRVAAPVVWTVLPGVQDLKGSCVVLRYKKSRIEVLLSELVLVPLVRRVKGERQGVGGRANLPVVHQPFEQQVQVSEQSIGVDVYAGLVLCQELRNDCWFFPGSAAIKETVHRYIVVLVSVYLTIQPVVEDSERQAMHRFCFLPSHDMRPK